MRKKKKGLVLLLMLIESVAAIIATASAGVSANAGDVLGVTAII